MHSPVPDEIAHIALYHVIYDAPKPHWDRDTCIQWLNERGIDAKTAQALIATASKYMSKHAAIESELVEFNRQTKNSLASEVQAKRLMIEQRRHRELRMLNEELNAAIGPEGRIRLSRLLLDVKSNIKINSGGSK